MAVGSDGGTGGGTCDGVSNGKRSTGGFASSAGDPLPRRCEWRQRFHEKRCPLSESYCHCSTRRLAGFAESVALRGQTAMAPRQRRREFQISQVATITPASHRPPNRRRSTAIGRQRARLAMFGRARANLSAWRSAPPNVSGPAPVAANPPQAKTYRSSLEWWCIRLYRL